MVEEEAKDIDWRDLVLTAEVLKELHRYASCSRLDAESSAVNILKNLSGGYVGTARMCSIVGEWLCNVRGHAFSSAPNGKEVLDRGIIAQSPACEQIVDGIADLLSNRYFSVDRADAILAGEEVPQWLLQLLSQPRTRRFLLELYNCHPHSKLLEFCLRFMSSLGAHEEISSVIAIVPTVELFLDLLALRARSVGDVAADTSLLHLHLSSPIHPANLM